MALEGEWVSKVLEYVAEGMGEGGGGQSWFMVSAGIGREIARVGPGCWG